MSENGIVLTLNNAQATQLRELYSVRLDELRANPVVQEYEGYRGLLDLIESQLHVQGSLRTETSVTQANATDVEISVPLNTVNEVFDANWSMSKKAEFAIKLKGKPITTREIITIMEANDPDMYKGTDFDRVQKNLSSTLKQKVDKNSTFFRYRLKDGFEYYYGLIAESGKYNGAIPQNAMPLFN